MKSRFLSQYAGFSLALGALTVWVSSASAQTPQPIPIGPFDFQASLLTEYIQDDNLYQSSSAEQETGIFIVSPTFELLFDNGVSGVSMAYSLENATFTDVSEENYTDQRFDIAAGTLFGGLHRIELSGSYVESHDRQTGGDGASDDPADRPSSSTALDEFEDVNYEAGYTLGTDESILNFYLSTGGFERTYVNNRATTADSDREEILYRTALFWNVSSGLRTGVSYTDTEIEYANPQPDRDGSEEVIALELEWDALDTLSFNIGLGQTERTTDSGTTNDSDYWDVVAEWAVLSYSTLSFFSASYVDEAEATGAGFSVREEAGFGWDHEWSDRVRTEFSYVDTTISYETDGVPREDNSEEVNLRASYQFRRWASISVFIQNITRSSSAGNDEEYDQQIYGISGLFTL